MSVFGFEPESSLTQMQVGGRHPSRTERPRPANESIIFLPFSGTSGKGRVGVIHREQQYAPFHCFKCATNESKRSLTQPDDRPVPALLTERLLASVARCMVISQHGGKYLAAHATIHFRSVIMYLSARVQSSRLLPKDTGKPPIVPSFSLMR